MKTSSAAKPLKPAAARNCFLMNQFATPGLGSLMGGRILPRIGQLVLALIGFVLIIFWFVLTLKEYYGLIANGPDTPSVSYLKFGVGGGLFFAASWLWSLLTSLSLVRDAKTPEPLLPDQIPPRITNPPGKM
jgi:hypothetical protein